MGNYQFTDSTHPCANGREAQEGEESVPIYIPLDDGGTLTVRLGVEGFIHLGALVAALLHDDPWLAAKVEGVRRGLQDDRADKGQGRKPDLLA